MTKPPKGGVPDGADVQALLDELAVRKEWRDYGHGPLHGQSYDMITQMWALIEPPVGGPVAAVDEAEPVPPMEQGGPVGEEEPVEEAPHPDHSHGHRRSRGSHRGR